MYNCVPTSPREATLIDKANGNHKWKQALDKEIKRHGSYGNRLSTQEWRSLVETTYTKENQEEDNRKDDTRNITKEDTMKDNNSNPTGNNDGTESA